VYTYNCKQQTTTYFTCGNANIASSHPRDLHLRAEERAWFQIATALNVFIKYKHVRTIILQTTARRLCNETQRERERERATDFSISPLTTCAQVGRDRGKNCSIFMCESCAGGWKSALEPHCGASVFACSLRSNSWHTLVLSHCMNLWRTKQMVGNAGDKLHYLRACRISLKTPCRVR